MKTIGFVKYAGALLMLAICSACSGGSALTPSAGAFNVTHIGKMLFVNGRPVTAARLTPMPRFMTIAPDRHKQNDFEYVFNLYGTYASIFDWPKSDQQIGSIYGDGGQGCTNVLYGYGSKFFWNVGGQTAITEYKAPQTPIKTLSAPYSFPTSCAMDSSGDLAVGVFYESGPGGGDILIYKNASGSPTILTSPLASEYFDGYDNNGNLFADGYDSNSSFRLVELPKGSSKFKTIATSNAIGFPGSVQWDGTYLTVVDQDTDQIHQYTVSGTKATLKNSVALSDSGDCAQTWIAKRVVFCGDSGGDGEVYKYPAGGSAIAVFSGSFDEPLGVVAVQK